MSNGWLYIVAAFAAVVLFAGFVYMIWRLDNRTPAGFNRHGTTSNPENDEHQPPNGE
jgi:hypothetical protein